MAWLKRPINQNPRPDLREVLLLAEFDAAEELSLLPRAGVDQSLLVAMPSEAKNSLTSLKNVSKIVKQSFFALVICAAADIFAGFSIAKMSYLLALYPGLIILIPSSINLRGLIFASFGARLGTSFHTGEISPPLGRSEALRQQVGGVVVQTLFMPLILAFVVKGFGLAAGLETMTIYDLVLIAVISSLLSGAILLVFTLSMIDKSFKKGWDPDNISMPLITAAGDVITIPLLFASAIVVSKMGSTLEMVMILLFIMFSTAALVYCLGSGHIIMARIVRQSLPVLAVAMVIDTVAGIFMGLTEEMLITLSVVLLLIPVFNAEGGNLGGILSSRLTSAYHLGLIRMGRRPEGETRTNFICTLLLSIMIFPTLGIIAYGVSEAFGLVGLGFGEIVFICLVAGLFTTVIAIVVTYYFTYFFVKIGVDPDNVTIPMITSVMDVFGTASLILVTMAVISA
ncbi:MAG TPA: magnesium transporter [Methanothrix sp.]|nr:magnesium transporter [Methanothrix sp.]HRW82101.1 magnesium transporter [Methanothrix sp.]